MRISLLTLSLAVPLLLGSLAHADDAPPAQDADDQPVSSSHHNYFVGLGFFNDTIDANAEVVTRFGNFAYSLAKDQNQQLLSHFNWRRPIVEGLTGHDSGYYVGVFGGQVADYTIGGSAFRLLGGGVDLGYHWVDDYTRKIAAVGIGTTQKIDNNGEFRNSEPTIFFTFNIAIGAR